jgi:hypothetical protein
MKDTLGYLKKTLTFFSFLLSFFLLSTQISSASEEFSISSSFKHTINADSSVDTVVDLNIKANSTPRVLSFYTITITETDIDPEISLVNSDKEMNTSSYERDNATDIVVTFKDLVISNTKDTTIRIRYSTPLEKEGNKITLGSKLTDITTSNITVTYPKELGSVVWSSNTLTKFSGISDYYKAEMANPTSEETILVLGTSLVYDFSITRSLNNTLGEKQSFDVTLPHDNPSQTLILENISPTPDTSTRDDEGNLTVSYVVERNSQLDISISGKIMLLEAEYSIDKPTNPFLTEAFSYWNISEEQEITNITRYIDRNWIDLPEGFEGINDFATDSKKKTFYKSIYNYIVNRLDVDKTSSTVLQGGSRDGAKAVLENVSKADADDYADLCVAIYRQFDIPAKMVIGYLTDVSGITEDGIFHSWCEYYDDVEKDWISLDPFLEDYKNVNLYHSSLRDHIKIISRGKSPVSPKLAFYSENDFRAESGEENVIPTFNFTGDILFEDKKLSSKYLKGSIVIKNTGNIPITQISIAEENIPLSENIDVIANEHTLLLLPNESVSIPFNVPMSDVHDAKEISLSVKSSSESLFTKTIDIDSTLELIISPMINFLSYSLVGILFIGISSLIYLIYKRVEK